MRNKSLKRQFEYILVRIPSSALTLTIDPQSGQNLWFNSTDFLQPVHRTVGELSMSVEQELIY